MSVVLQRIKTVLWDASTYLVPIYKKVYDVKLMHYRAAELVKGICREIALLRNQFAVNDLVNFPFVVAAEYGTLELLLALHCSFPALIQAVEKITRPNYRNILNAEVKPRTPRDIFNDEHDNLFEKGKKWMKEIALSCSFVATIIATVVFTSAFTVPGVNKSNIGMPIFLKNRFLMLFAISDALALISSLTSVLVFLSVLTSRYAEEDFLESLPRKLIIGFATLFFSIAAMVIAFSSTYFIMFSNGFGWVAALVASLTCLLPSFLRFYNFPSLLK
ncbi:hypothetical protein GIB67_026451 [Kingdonia uniflora]|uniref:PGG domain-containing protein n=1 Tax=Kingdonia uniflora TaxID=39325 RepID=A0A7J7P6L8_9MAGN|nr:hypothetical protein GIB67_026451 [Kingdonia uniflora]